MDVFVQFCGGDFARVVRVGSDVFSTRPTCEASLNPRKRVTARNLEFSQLPSLRNMCCSSSLFYQQ